MSGTTTNYGWTYPSSTDLAKLGASDIQTLATGVDTTLGTALNNKTHAGLVLINKTSFTSVSSVSLNNVFTSTYKDYVIKFDQNNSSDITMQLRAGGSNATGNSYAIATFYGAFTGAHTAWACSSAYDRFYLSGAYSKGTVNIQSPQVADYTLYNSQAASISATVPFFHGGGYYGSTTQFDGFTLFFGGSSTGTVTVLGVAQS